MAQSAAGGEVPLAVVTVAYRSGPCLERLADDLARQGQPPELWVVVDNSPLQAPLEATALARGGLELLPLRGQEGAGFGAGCNQAFDHLAQRRWPGWIWLLNPDIRLPVGDELERLRRALAPLPAHALVGTAVEDDEGRLEASAGWLGSGLAFRGRVVRERPQQPGGSLAVDWLSGCSLALRPEAHTPPARFDPAFPLYYEDLDLCRRLGGQGAPLLWLPQPTLRHGRGEGSRTSSARRLRLSSLGYLRYLRRHCGRRVLAVRGARLVLLNLLRLPLRPRRSAAALGAALTVAREGGPPR